MKRAKNPPLSGWATLVVPCFNEEHRLDADAFLTFARERAETRFLFVNDGSVDGTWGVLNAIREQAPNRVSLLNLVVNGGKAEAVRRGVLTAIEEGAEFVGYWDADLATPLAISVIMLEILRTSKDLDVVLGSRVKLLGHDIRRRSHRHLAGRVFATFASLVVALPVYDTQCGAKLFRTGPWLREAFEQPFLSRWIFDVELIARIKRIRAARGLSNPESCFRELPLPEWRDVAGSRLRASDLPKALIDLTRIYRAELSRR